MRSLVACLALSTAVAMAAACGGAPERQEWVNTFRTDDEDLFVVDDDLVCLTDPRWTKVENFRVWNPLHHDVAVEHARTHALGAYPVGTVVQLFHNEASVKRGRGFSPATDDWEFLKIAVDDNGDTVITERGTTEVGNAAGSCTKCHGAAIAFDTVCGTNNSCAPLPFFIDTEPDSAQEDPRCQ